MRYVPNLIPNSSKVLPDYFKGDIYRSTKNTAGDKIMWILGICFFLLGLAFIGHPLLFLLLVLIGFILIPIGHQFLEKTLRFRLTPKLKIIATLILFVASVPLTIHYSEIDQIEANQQKLLDEEATKEKAITEQREQQRKYSLAFYIQQSKQFEKNHKINEAIEQLNHASAFTLTQTDKDQIEKEKVSIAIIKTIDLIKAGKYQAALPYINTLLSSNPTNSKLLYNRAICYSNTGNIQKAVNDLKGLIQNGNSEAEKLNAKINPIRKRIIGYETLCCDESTSNARGSGACSHHGGVCNWDYPIYEEYRKYD